MRCSTEDVHATKNGHDMLAFFCSLSDCSNIPSEAINKESNATLANCSVRCTCTEDIGASLYSSLEEDEELEESAESLFSSLASLEFADAAALTQTPWTSLRQPRWDSLAQPP